MPIYDFRFEKLENLAIQLIWFEKLRQFCEEKVANLA